MTFWRARDVYRARRGVESLVIFLLLLEGGYLWVTLGRAAALTTVGLQAAFCCTAWWVLRQAWRWVRGR
jgi:hypothetical protein